MAKSYAAQCSGGPQSARFFLRSTGTMSAPSPGLIQSRFKRPAILYMHPDQTFIHLRHETRDSVTLVTLGRPEKLNALGFGPGSNREELPQARAFELARRIATQPLNKAGIDRQVAASTSIRWSARRTGARRWTRCACSSVDLFPAS